MTQKYDLVVIGAGPGGYVASIRAAQLGLKVACVEKEKTLGGTCLNVGCIPSKALLDSSEHYINAKETFQKHGIETTGLKVNLKQMMKRKTEVIKKLTDGVDYLFKKNKIESYSGRASLKKENGLFQVSIQNGKKSEVIEGSKVICATGSQASELPNLAFDGKNILSSTEILDLDAIPKSLLIVGGGYIGLEMASVWSRLGTKVTVIEFMDALLPICDQELAKELHKTLKKQKIDIHTGKKCLGAKVKKGSIDVEVETRKTEAQETFQVEKVLICAGRTPYSEGLGLKKLGVEQDKRGFVSTKDNFETACQGLYAIGDLTHGPMLAHKAEEEAVACVNSIAGKKAHVHYATIPSVIYTWPELSSVGFTEEELKEKSIPFKKGSFPFAANGRAIAMNESGGKVKILSHKESDKILGVHILGPRASDMIAEAVALMECGQTARKLAEICHAHPTLSESVKEAALAVNKEAIHI